MSSTKRRSGGTGWAGIAALPRMALALLSAVAVLPIGGVIAQSESESESDGAQTIAQGVDLMPEVPVVWRVLEATAEVREDAPFAVRTLGFVLGDEGEVLVTDEVSGEQTVVDPGEASFHREGVSQQRASLEDDSTGYLAIELIVADAAEDPESIGDADLSFVSEEFTAPAANHELSLRREVLDGEQTVEIPEGESTALLLVTDGELTGTDDADETIEVVAGDIIDFTGAIQLEAGEDGATYVVADIGREVEPPPTPEPEPTGTLFVTLYDCPQGSDPQQDASDCVDTEDAAGVVVADLDDPDVGIEGERDGATFTFAELTPSTYALLGLREEDDERLIYAAPPAEGGQQDVLVEVGAGEEVAVDVFRYPDPTASAGTLSITIFDCPEGVDPAAGGTEECAPGADDFGAAVERLDDTGELSGEVIALGDAARDGDAYVLEGLPPAVYALQGFGPVNPDIAFYAAPPAEAGPNGYVIEVPAGETIELEVYRFTPESGGGETGTVVLTVFDCPPGVDATVDASECTPIDDPYLFYLFDTDSLEIVAFTDDAGRDGDAYVFELEPGTYGIGSDNVPAGVLVAAGGDAVTTQDGAQITIAAGATASADVFTYVLDEGAVDTDGDGVSDVDEDAQGTDPNDPAAN